MKTPQLPGQPVPMLSHPLSKIILPGFFLFIVFCFVFLFFKNIFKVFPIAALSVWAMKHSGCVELGTNAVYRNWTSQCSGFAIPYVLQKTLLNQFLQRVLLV